MSIISEKKVNSSAVNLIAQQMMIAARTAPKARGLDNLEIIMVEGDTISQLSEKMKEIGTREKANFPLRDAGNILQSPAIVIIGSAIKSIGLQDICGFCGHKNCVEKDKYPEQPCFYNSHDLGIAVASAVAIAADNRVDNRVMFSIGKAALELNLFTPQIKLAIGIPLSATSKNPFFDRK